MIAASLGLLFASSACAAQMYTVTDLGTLGGMSSYAYAINASGQVVGYSYNTGHTAVRGFRTAPNRPINPATDDLGTLGGAGWIEAHGINDSGQVVGIAYTTTNNTTWHAFRTAPNRPINPATDDLGTLGGVHSYAYGINDSGQVVGYSLTKSWYGGDCHAFRTAPNRSINSATDDLGPLGGSGCIEAHGINDSGQVVGESAGHAFRTAANVRINAASDDLGKLRGTYSAANGINASGGVWHEVTASRAAAPVSSPGAGG